MTKFEQWNTERKKPYTVTELAKIMGVTRSTIYRWFAGQQPTEKYDVKIKRLTKGKVKVNRDPWTLMTKKLIFELKDGRKIVEGGALKVTYRECYYSNNHITLGENDVFIGKMVMSDFCWCLESIDGLCIPLGDIFYNEFDIEVLY